MKKPSVRSFAVVAAACLSLMPAHSITAASHSLATNPPLVIDVGYEPVTMDPQIDYDTAAAIPLANAYDGLVRAVGVKSVKIVPDIALSWKQSADGKTWTFKLRQGVKFHDGSTVDAAAVKYTFDRLFALNQGAVSDFSEIGSVTVSDPTTVVFHLKTPASFFLTSLTSVWGTGIVSPTTVKAHQVKNDWGKKWLYEHDAGSGPWTISQWVHNQKIVLNPFPGYWRGWSGAHVGQVVYQWPSASSTQRLGLEHGDTDIAMNMTPQDFDAVSHESGISVQDFTAQTIRDIRLNNTKGPLKNRLVRQALSYSFDYNTFVKAVFKGHAARMTGVGPTGFANYVPAKHLYTYDPNKAKQLLSQAGYGNGVTLQVTWQTGDIAAQQMAQIWKAEVAPLGIKMNLQPLTSAQYNSQSQKPTTMPDVFFGQWTMDYADDQQEYFLFYYSKVLPPANSNVMYYKNPTVDTMLEQAMAATDSKKAADLYAKICDTVYNDAVEIWAAQPNDRVAIRSNVHGFVYNFLYSSYYYDLYALSKS
ncbi:MAG: extracellular solute-binding protein family 5 [Chloroflexi bacterium]|nr:extracellular solute-binding protein family 5 [Chloroflexota bacterium]